MDELAASEADAARICDRTCGKRTAGTPPLANTTQCSSAMAPGMRALLIGTGMATCEDLDAQMQHACDKACGKC
jgi:hypothetical protein